MSENKIIDYNGILNTVKQGYSFETDKEYWNKAQNLLPELNLPEYEDIFEDYRLQYPSNPKDAIMDDGLINSSLNLIDQTFNNQDVETILSYINSASDYPEYLKEQINKDTKAWNNNSLPGAFGYGPYAANKHMPFNQKLYDQEPAYAAMHNLFLTNPEKWEENYNNGAYSLWAYPQAMITDEKYDELYNKEREDWYNKVNLTNRERESKVIKEFVGDDVLSNPNLSGHPLFGTYNKLSSDEKKQFNLYFGDWENEGRYVELFGGKIPLPRFKQDDDGLWTEIEDGRNRSSIFNMFGDEWLNKNSRTPDWIKTPIKIGINNTVPGISYAIDRGEEIYTDIPEYEYTTQGGGLERAGESLFTGLLTFTASMSDPVSIGSMFVPYALGGRIALGTTSQGIKTFQKAYSTFAPSKLQTWFNHANSNHILTNMPRFMHGTQGYKIKTGIQNLITSKGFQRTIYDIGGFSTLGAYHGTLHSRKNQRLNLGKYADNNGTINGWDTFNDAWRGYLNGASMALLFRGSSHLFGRSNMLQNSYFKKGTLKSKIANYTTKVGELGTGGAILTTVPMAFDKDVRQQYYDADGNFDLAKLAADTMINTGILTLFWGIRNFDVKSFRAKEKGLVHIPVVTYKFKPYTGGKFSGNSKRDVRNIVVKATDNNAITVPSNRSFPKFLNEIKLGLTVDGEYEKNKLTNKNHYSNDGKNTLKNSLANVEKELGPESGFEFFDEISKIDAGEIETVRGLKSIKAIVDETIKILDKGAIKDRNGNIIGIDGANITASDQNFLLYVTPTAVKAYQGYIMQYNDTDAGKAEYIKRFEMEKNNGKKISPAMEKTVLRALEMRLNRFDLISRDFNSMLQYGDTKAEQPVVNPENKSSLAPEYMEVVLVENGKPITGDILSVEKDQALKGIEEGKFIKKSDAKSQALGIGEVESPNQGMVTTADQEEMFARILNKALDLQKPYSSQIKTTKGEYPKFIEPYREGELGHKSLERKVDSKITTSHIKDPWDIAVLGGKESPIGAKELKKRIPALNSLMESSGKKSLSEITTDDIRKWGNDRIAEIKKENAGKHINEQKPAVMQNNPISNVKKIFEALQQKGFIKLNPVTTEVQKYFSSHGTKTKQTLRAKQTGLPELKVWYEKMPKIYDVMMKKNKDYQVALALGDHLSVRSMEIQALKGEHISRHSKTGIPYLDLLTPTTEGGAAKGRGVLRPVAISEGLYNELIKIADKKQPGALLFPGYQKLLTKELQKLFPTPKYIKVTAKDFKNQQISLALRHANLSPEETRIFNTISGHAGDAAKIVEEYLAKANMGDLLKLQVKVMKKVNAARIELENTMKSMPLEKAIEKVMKFVKEDLSIGLSIKDVSGKKPNEIVKTVNKEVKQGEILTSNVKKKFAASVEKVFNDLVPKNLDVSERSAMISFYAKNAGIEDYNNFNFKSATTEELVLFSDKIVREPKVFTTKTRNLVSRMENIGLARRIFEANNYNNERQRRFIQLAFFPEKELSEVSYLQLDHKQSVELVNLIKGEETLNTVYDAKNNIIKDKFDYVHLAINTDNIANLSKQMPTGLKTALYTGLLGTTHVTFPWLAKKLNAPHLIKIGEDLSNRRLAESRIGGYVQDFETTIYKTIYNFAKEKGDFNRLRLLMPSVIRGGTIGIGKLKTYVPLVSLPDVQTVVRSLAGDEQYKYKYGMKIFDNHIKHNLWSLDPKRYNDLKEHVLAHPEDKVGVKRFEAAKPFHEGVYVTENNYKELGLTKKAIGSLRTDTMESYIAREWHKYTDKLWDHTLLVLRKSMTDARWDTFIKKYPLVEIKKHFYVPIIHTEVFGDHYGFGQINLDKKILRRGISHAKKHAKEKYGDKPTQKQIDEFLEIGKLEAYSDVNVMQSSYQGNKQNPKHILRRRFYTGERVFIEKQNKWVDAIEHDYDMSIRPHAATMAKTIANIEYFPFLVGIPGLKFNHNYPKVLAELSNRGGAVGSYINDMILAETGLTPPSNKVIATTNDVITAMNKYASRIILMGVRSPLKNLLIGSNQNLLGWDTHKVLYQHTRSLSYRNRIEARKTGYMGLSLSKLTENEDKLLSVILDKMWHTFKFRSSEESTRLSSMFLAMDEVPALTDALNSKNPKIAAEAYDRATTLYEVLETPIEISKDIIIKGGELEILKKLGTDIDFKYDITKKDFGVNRLITVNRDLTPMERKILKDEIEKVHFKIISRAHEKAQGSTAPLDQPLIIQTPILSGGALFAKMAIRATEWTFRGINDARKHNNWNKIFGYGAGIFATGLGLLAFDELLKGLPNPRELDRKDWKKIFRILKTAEQGGIASIFWGIAEGKMPMGNPVFGFAQVQVVQEVGKYLLEKFTQTTEAVGIKPEAVSRILGRDFAQYFISMKPGWKAEKDLISAVNGAYREWRAIKENKMSPYRKESKRLNEWEEHFYTHVMPLSSKPQIVKNHINSAEYAEIKDAFELTEFEKDGDFTRINEIVFSTFQSLYWQKIAANYPPDEAIKLAQQSIEAKLLALDPILNGIGQSGKHKSWFSIRDGYMKYLIETAIAQGKDKNHYLVPLANQKIIYDKKIKSFYKQFPGWIRKNKSKEMEAFMLKAMTNIHPKTWDLLGLPDMNTELLKRFKKDLNK